MQIIFLTGRRVGFRASDVWPILKEPAVLIFIAVAAFVSFFVNPHADVRAMSVPLRATFILATSAVTVLALVVPILLLARPWARYLPVPLPSVVLLGLACLASDVCARIILATVLGYPAIVWAGLGDALLTNVTMLAIFEILFSLYVLPTSRWYRDRLAAVSLTRAPAPTPHKTVRIAGQVFPLRAILSIEAEEHYVRVRFDGRTLLLRETFSSVLSQLEDADGVQTHRSFWVNFAHVDQILSDRRGKIELRLSSGDVVPVSRRRRKECDTLLARKGLTENPDDQLISTDGTKPSSLNGV